MVVIPYRGAREPEVTAASVLNATFYLRPKLHTPCRSVQNDVLLRQHQRDAPNVGFACADGAPESGRSSIGHKVQLIRHAACSGWSTATGALRETIDAHFST
jgi:hypothetical protein